MIKFAKDSEELDLETTLKKLEDWPKEEIERGMYLFFEEEAAPRSAYTDRDMNQGGGGPKKDFVEGEWKRYRMEGIRLRMGVGNDMIPSLQLIVERNTNPELVVEYTAMYGPRLEYANAHGKKEYEFALEVASRLNKLVGLYIEKNKIQEQIDDT